MPDANKTRSSPEDAAMSALPTVRMLGSFDEPLAIETLLTLCPELADDVRPYPLCR